MTQGLAQGCRAGWEKAPPDLLSYKAQTCYLQNSEVSFHVQPSFELGLFVFSKEENLAPSKGPRKVLPWLLRTENAHMVASGNSNTSLPWSHSPQRGVQVFGHLEGPLPLQAAMETKNNTDKRVTAYDMPSTATASLGGVYSCSQFSLLFVDLDFTTGTV